MRHPIILVLCLFLFVFQPPFIPIATIYWLGPIIGLLLLFNHEGKHIIRNVYRNSSMSTMWKFFIIVAIYITAVNIIDIFVDEGRDVTLARLRSYNQLLVLSGLQFLFVLYFLITLKKLNYSFEDAIKFLVYAACFEGILASIAYVSPPIRSLFMTYGNQALNANMYYLEKRGFGFSQNLIDTFGFGMGLISGYIILFKWKKDIKSIYIYTVCLLFSLLAIALNARTGILVFIIAIIVRLLFDKNIFKFLIRLSVLAFASSLILTYVNKVINIGIESNNITINWISLAFAQIVDQFTGNNTTTTVDDLSFISNIVELPSSGFEFLFGTGHWIYDTGKEMGFRTDIGWYNLAWEFGIVGTLFVMFGLSFFMLRPFFMSSDISIKRISLFNTISYYVVLMKAILLGSNPGTFVLYYSTFCMYYYIRKNDFMKRSLNRNEHYVSTI